MMKPLIPFKQTPILLSMLAFLYFGLSAARTGGQPATPRGLSQLHHCCGGPRPPCSHLGLWEHSNWYVFVV